MADWLNANLGATTEDSHAVIFYDKNGNVVATSDKDNRRVDVPASSTLRVRGAVDLSAATSVSFPTTTMSLGRIPLPLAEARLIATNDIAAKNAADGGLVSLDTAPTFKRINAATDKNLRITWAATVVIPITWGIVIPSDLDDTAAMTVNLLLGKGSNTDTTMTLGVAYFEGVGDTNAGGNTAAITSTTGINLYTVTIAASDIAAAPNTATIELTPGTHGNDDLYLFGAYCTYTRKTA